MLAKAEQARQDENNAQLSQPLVANECVSYFEDQPDIEDVSHEQLVLTNQLPVQVVHENMLVFSDLQGYGWETEEEIELATECYE